MKDLDIVMMKDLETRRKLNREYLKGKLENDKENNAKLMCLIKVYIVFNGKNEIQFKKYIFILYIYIEILTTNLSIFIPVFRPLLLENNSVYPCPKMPNISINVVELEDTVANVNIVCDL